MNRILNLIPMAVLLAVGPCEPTEDDSNGGAAGDLTWYTACGDPACG